jgi:phosphate transport system substrate-binding protein
MIRHRAVSAALFLALVATAAKADERAVRVVGSSSLFPFATSVAEALRRASPFKAPVVESMGTGGGFKAFCAGVGLGTPDIATASRPITAFEREVCRAAGVANIQEIRIGHGGVVLVRSRGAAAFALTRRQIWLALARQVVKDGKLVPNPHRRWRDVDASLPDEPIRVHGPPPTSGTRDLLAQVAMEGGCSSFRLVRDLAPEARREACEHIREDGVYIDSGEDDDRIVRRAAADRESVAIVDFGALRRHGNLVQGIAVEEIAPTPETIAAGSYPLSRDLYLYVKPDHLNSVRGLAEYLREFTSAAAIGPDGYLVPLGLVPLEGPR